MIQSIHLKSIVMLLLLINAFVFWQRGEYNDCLDSLAWLALMTLYAIESGSVNLCHRANRNRLLLRNMVVILIVVAEGSYLVEGAWLDAGYSLIWLGVMLFLEFECRYPQSVVDHPRYHRWIGYGLLFGMSAIIVGWIMEEAYFNAYDGLIWCLAFLIIDLDLMASALVPRPQFGEHHANSTG